MGLGLGWLDWRRGEGGVGRWEGGLGAVGGWVGWVEGGKWEGVLGVVEGMGGWGLLDGELFEGKLL